MNKLARARNFALALSTAVLLVLIFPRFDLTWLAPVALAPFLFAVDHELRLVPRFLLGWTAGIVFWFGVCYWIQFVLEYHGGMGRWGGWGTFLVFCVLKAIHLGLFGLLAGFVPNRAWSPPVVAALWTGIERTHGTFGFAWLTLGNAGIDMGWPMRLAPLVGVYGLSFAFALTAAAVARRRFLWVAPLLLLGLLPRLPDPAQPTASALVVQPNLDEEQTWTSDSAQQMQRHLVSLSLGGADLIVWPEVPGPLYFYRDYYFREQAMGLARFTHTYFLFGTVAETPAGEPLNSALLLSPVGEPVDRYDKLYLVPFGEFVPPVFSWVNRITNEAGDFAPGKRLVVFPMGTHKLGVFICYESAFPHLVRRFAAAGADMLVNISNDGYFGHSAARQQHLSLVRMRAAENRRWILRATNDGITATVDPAGHITDRLAPYREQAARMRFSYASDMTLYTRYGDWFAWGCLAIGLATVTRAGLLARRHP